MPYPQYLTPPPGYPAPARPMSDYGFLGQSGGSFLTGGMRDAYRGLMDPRLLQAGISSQQKRPGWLRRGIGPSIKGALTGFSMGGPVGALVGGVGGGIYGSFLKRQ